jgi:hypothetical protein
MNWLIFYAKVLFMWFRIYLCWFLFGYIQSFEILIIFSYSWNENFLMFAKITLHQKMTISSMILIVLIFLENQLIIADLCSIYFIYLKNVTNTWKFCHYDESKTINQRIKFFNNFSFQNKTKLFNSSVEWTQKLYAMLLIYQKHINIK